MNFNRTFKTAAMAALGVMLLAPNLAQAQSIGEVENARAKERQGRWLNHQDRDNLRRYGSNDDYGRYYGLYGHAGDYYGPRYYRAPSVGIYVGRGYY